jgi:hypothetical protein
MKWNFLTLLLIFSCTFLSAQSTWQLKKSNDGINVYYRDVENSSIKELRMEATFKTTLSNLVSFLYKVDSYKEWVYSFADARLEKQVNEKEIYYYGLVDFPWPLWDRDYFAHSTIHQDNKTGKVTIISKAVPDYKPDQKGIVRIKDMSIKWELTPTENGMVKVLYYLKSDPGGDIPAWAINMALDKGPLQTLTQLRQLVQQQDKKLAMLSFIDDFEGRK